MKKTKSKKAVTINSDFCKACAYCIETCPDNALSFKETFNANGYHPVEWQGDCSLCGFCYMVCPDNAIQIKEQ
ncbi:MAG: 4Fe-4S dicluster domain-containing protein [Elusimicrobiota bacterium]